MLSEFHLVVRRSLANWRLLSTVIVGVLITVAFLSSTPFYANAINDLGLSHSLRENEIEMLDIQVHAPNYTVSYDNYRDAEGIISQQISRNIRPIVRQEERWIQSQSYFAGWADRPVPAGADRPEGYFHVFTNLDKHVNILNGKLAAPPPAGLTAADIERPDFAIEAMIGSQTAKKFDVGVGDRLVFIVGSGETEKRMNIELTAIIEPTDPEEEFWFLKNDVFTVDGLKAPLFIPEQTLFEAVNLYSPSTRANFNWFYFVDLNKINTENAGIIKDAVERMDRQLLASLPRVATFTTLDVIIKEYQSKLMFTRIPLFLIVSQIVAIILYYLVTVSNMLIERQAGEIALFRSRGASTWQIIGIYFGEGLLITGIGAIIGPFLGAFIFSLLGMTAAFKPLTGGGLMPVRFSDSVLVLTAIAAGLCLFTLLVPAIQAARRGVVHQRQQAARPGFKPVWQRFYLDIVLLIFGGVLYWELRERGSLLTLNVFGGMGMDPVLLITPMLLLMAVAIIFLRLFPIIIGLATRFSRYVSNAPMALGLWYMARNPVHYGRLILLLVMAASVGVFSATFLGTLERSYNERAYYLVGSDVRLQRFFDWNTPKGTVQQRYSTVPGVENVSPAYRGDGVVGTLFTQTDLKVLAIDPTTLNDIAWYRDDFSSQPLSGVMNTLIKDAPIQQGLKLPEGTKAIGLWAYPEAGNLRTTVYVSLTDSQGRHIDFNLGSTANQTWRYLEADLTTFWNQSLPPYPLYLDVIYVRPQSGGGFGSVQGISFDDLQVQVGDSTVVIDDFESVSRWTVATDESSGSFSGQGTPQFRFVTNRQIVHSGDNSARLSWGIRRGTITPGVYADKDTRPLSAIASRSFLENAQLTVGGFAQVRISGQNVPLFIEDAIDYFPTLDPAERGFLIVNLDRLAALRNLDSIIFFYPNEVWLSLGGDERQRADAIEILKSPGYRAYEVYDTEELISNLKTDPLAGAGWSGVLMISFLGVILVSSLGFVLYNYLSAQQRQLDFAILRTLGFSLRQIIGLVCFEQLFIIIFGLGLGTVIGVRLSDIMMPFLQLTEKGERVLPPFILTIDWGIIGIAYVIMALAFVITISLVILFFSRVAIYRTLRMGDR
ncbi:MAG: FtsX-like permease family protein [Chloroflexi bacterium]|nr:FtsX-like permease family protein [Chloroflexota bacterium]